MPEGVRLRPAVTGDRDALAAMQEAAYAPNRAIIGGTPWPLTWDYADVLLRWQVWLAEDQDGLAGALILEWRPDDLFIQSIAVAPRRKGGGVGNRLLHLADALAVAADRPAVRLLTNKRMTFNVGWYGRQGYAIERIEARDDRRIVHMAKSIAPSL